MLDISFVFFNWLDYDFPHLELAMFLEIFLQEHVREKIWLSHDWNCDACLSCEDNGYADLLSRCR